MDFEKVYDESDAEKATGLSEKELKDPTRIGSYVVNSKIAYETAAQRGWDVVVGTPTLLLIDIDSKQQMCKMHRAMSAWYKILHIQRMEYTNSPGGRWHIYIHLPHDKAIEDPGDRCRMQALLGSDTLREALGALRHIRNDPQPTLFYELRNTPRYPYKKLYEDHIKGALNFKEIDQHASEAVDRELYRLKWMKDNPGLSMTEDLGPVLPTAKKKTINKTKKKK